MVHGFRTQRNIPPSPLQGGGKSESEGGMLSLQRGNAVRSAISKQRVVCRVGANLVFALFLCSVGNIRMQISQMARINAVRTVETQFIASLHHVSGMTIDN